MKLTTLRHYLIERRRTSASKGHAGEGAEPAGSADDEVRFDLLGDRGDRCCRVS